MRLLVFQHVACEHPGSLRRFLEQDGVVWDAVELGKGEPVPALEPYDAIALAASDVCNIQAMRVGDNAWSIEYHVEVEPDTVDNWDAIPAFRDALVPVIATQCIDAMRRQAEDAMPDFPGSAEVLYRNFTSADVG